jgi:hypothetical protein
MRFFSRRKNPATKPFLRKRQRAIEPLEMRSLLAANVLITEIMYHPASEDARDEYIEIYNAEPTALDLSGWKFSDGVDYTFPQGTTLGAGQYLAIAADTSRFENNYPTIDNFIGGWSGALSNSGETIELVDDAEDTVSRFTYGDEGDWAVREYATGAHSGYDGWRWSAPHDGNGNSLELVSRTLTNDAGQNWAASTNAGGTPGRVNSVDRANNAPVIRDMIHSPIIPRSTDNVTITARITDEQTSGLNVAVHWREATAVDHPGPSFTSATMFDDGLHGDGEANDGIYGALLLAKPDKTIIEFYVRASDSAGNARTWPSANHPVSGSTQGANALYQVDNTGVANPAVPDYRLIFTPFELSTFNSIDRGSNAEMNVTFVSVIDGVSEVRYNAGVRYRGNGSRNVTPPNQRVNFPDDNKWHGAQAINLNSRYSFLQHIGWTMFERAGLSAEHSEQVMVRRNGTILPNSGGEQMGYYVQLEPINEDWAENHFPGDADGNAYRGQNWTLDYRGPDAGSYASRVSKQTNVSENDYSDIIALGRAFSTSETPDNLFVQRIEAAINVQQWLRWLAVNALLVNEENGLINGFAGDEYTLYRGINDARFVIQSHDLDNLMGQGDQGGGSTTRDLFEPAAVASFNRLMNHPNYRPYYFAHLKQLAETVFAPNQFNSWLDAEMGNWLSQNARDNIKSFNQQRVSYVLSQIPQGTPNLSSPQDTLRVTEVMYNATNGGDNDFIEFKNTGPVAINLQGVTIGGGISYTFPSVNLNPNQTIVVAASESAFRARYGTVPNLAGEYSGNLNSVGEQILIKSGSPLFSTILDFTYSADWHPTTNGSGKSLVMINPSGAASSWNNPASWRPSQYEDGSPGAEDNETLLSNWIVINEVLSHTDLADGDRIELRNLTTLALNLTGYYLSDDSANRTKYRIPNGTTIAPNGFLAFNQSSNFGPPNTAGTPFGLSELGDELYLTSANGITTIDSIDFGAAESEVSFGRITTSTGEVDYPAMASTTFGAGNALPKIGPIVINELMYNPLADDPGETEFIELKNISTSTVQLFDPSRPGNVWEFTEGISFAFPSGVVLAPDAYLLVVPFDPAAEPLLAEQFRAAYNVPEGTALYGPYAGSLDSAGEKIELSKPGAPEPDLTVPLIVVDRVTYDDASPWATEPDGFGASLSRKNPAAYANDPASWDASRPNGTPGSVNTFADRSPPTTPDGVAAITPQAGQIALSWNTATDPDSGVSEYRVFRDGLHIASVSGTTFTDTAAAPRARFDYQVSAVNSGGLEGGRSSVVNAGFGAIDAVWPLDNSDTQLVVLFSEQVNATDAAVASKYTLTGASVISAAPRPDGRSVILTTSPLSIDQPYTLSIDNIGVTFGSEFPPGTSHRYTHQPLSPGVAARFANPFGTIANINLADAVLALPHDDPSLLAHSMQTLGRVNLVDEAGGNAGHFAANSAFPSTVLTSSPIAVRATGVIKVATAGTWTFGLTADAAQAGARLRIDGFDLIPHSTSNVNADRFGLASLPAGEHFVDLAYFSNSGTAGIELFAAPGNFTAFSQTASWRLVGDAQGGGLPLYTLPPAAIDLSWTPGTIPGGFITQSNMTTATADGGASLRYRTEFVPGQSFSLMATPTVPSAQVALTIRRGSQIVATTTAPGPGVAAWLDNVLIGEGGLHTIEISPSVTTTVALRASLGAGFEGEAFGHGNNDDLAAAQSLDEAKVESGERSRIAVAGSIVLPGVYHDLVAADNPIGYWRLDEAPDVQTGAVNRGSAGASFNGSYFGAVTLGQPPIVPNLAGTSPRFDGINDRIEFSPGTEFGTGGPYAKRTVSLWFNAADTDGVDTETANGKRAIYDEGDSQRGLNVYLDEGKLYVGAYNMAAAGSTPAWGPVFLDTPVAANQTYHVALTLDGTAGTVAGYLNGVAFGQATSAGPLPNYSTSLRIGRRTDMRFHDAAVAGSGDLFLGAISEVSVYNAVLTADRVAEHYIAGAAKVDDFYALSLAPDEPISIVVDGATTASWTIELQNAAGDVLATSASGSGNIDAEIRNFSAEQAGEFFLRIRADVASTYSLLATRGSEVEREPNDSLAAAQDISSVGAVWGAIESAGAVDAYAITVAAGESLTIETATPDTLVGANGAAWDPRIELHGPDGDLLASDDNSAPDGRNARIVHTAAAAGTYVVVVHSSVGTGDYLLTVDTSGGSETPNLVDVAVSGGQWTPAFVASLDVNGLGQSGYSVRSHTSSDPNLTWTNIDRIQLTFDRLVSTGIDEITVTGALTGAHPISTFEINAGIDSSIVATWILASPLPADRYTVDLSPALEFDLGGTPRQYQFAVLPGDLNDDETVSLADLAVAHTSQFRATTDGGYDPRHDVDGNARINFVDSIFVRNHIGASLPAGAPSPSTAAAIVASAGNSRAAAIPATTALRAAPRRTLAATAVDRVIGKSAEASLQADSATRSLGGSTARRSAVLAERPAALRALSRLNLDAARPGDVS